MKSEMIHHVSRVATEITGYTQNNFQRKSVDIFLILHKNLFCGNPSGKGF